MFILLGLFFVDLRRRGGEEFVGGRLLLPLCRGSQQTVFSHQPVNSACFCACFCVCVCVCVCVFVC
jgi:hypothetical protein